jgi:hypothetical protein
MPLDSLVGANGRLGRHAAQTWSRARGNQSGEPLVRDWASSWLQCAHDRWRPAHPDRAKADRCLPAPPTVSSTLTSARDARRHRRWDVGGLTRSKTAQAVRVRILVRVAAPVTHQPSGKASDPKTPPSGGSEQTYCP